MTDHIMKIAVSAYQCLSQDQRLRFAAAIVEEEKKAMWPVCAKCYAKIYPYAVVKVHEDFEEEGGGTKENDHNLLCLIREYHTTCLGELEFRRRIRKLACKKVDEGFCDNYATRGEDMDRVKKGLEEM